MKCLGLLDGKGEVGEEEKTKDEGRKRNKPGGGSQKGVL